MKVIARNTLNEEEYRNFLAVKKIVDREEIKDAWLYIFAELSIFALALLMIGTALLKIN